MIVTNEGTNIATELVTNEAGQFTALYLPAGTYRIEVKLTGFATFRRTGIALASSDIVRVPVELTMAQVGETVQVSAEAPLLQTDRTSVSGAVGAEMIEALPNITQNPLHYAMLQAGAIGRNSTQDPQSLNSFGIGVDGRRNWSAVRNERGSRVHQRYPARRPAGDGRRLQRSRRGPEHRRPPGSPRHLQQLQRRVQAAARR